MSRQRPIALAGLSATEQILLEGALFQPGSTQIPGACQVHDLLRAELVIANADDLVSVRMLQSLTLSGRVLLIGASDAGTGWPLVSRPLRLHAVLEAARRALPASHPAGPGGSPSGLYAGSWRGPAREAAGFAATQPFTDAVEPGDFEATRQFASSRLPSPPETAPPVLVPRDTPLGDAASFSRTPTVPHGTPAHPPLPPDLDPDDGEDFAATQQFSSSVPSVAPSGWEQEESVRGQDAGLQPPVRPEGHRSPEAGEVAVPADRILVVGHPGTAAGGLLRTLKSEGFPADFASGEELTFRQLAQQPYGFVFLIEVSLGPQAIQLCDAIRKRPNVSPQSLRIVIVASHRGLFSRIRAWFAGCSAWMAIPLEKAALLQYLQLHRAEGSARD